MIIKSVPKTFKICFFERFIALVNSALLVRRLVQLTLVFPKQWEKKMGRRKYKKLNISKMEKAF